MRPHDDLVLHELMRAHDALVLHELMRAHDALVLIPVARDFPYSLVVTLIRNGGARWAR